jgi:SAM-dependent methyltransferase
MWPIGWSCRACGFALEVQDDIPILAPTLADTVAGFDPAIFEPLVKRESANFWFVPRNRLITSLLARYFPAADQFMEIGCGSGFVLSAIARARPWRRLVASELHPAGLVIARKRLGGRAEFVQMDARDIPAREAFDVIGAFDVLEHIEEDEAVLTAMRLALRRDGGILLAVPQHPILWSRDDERALHVRRYRRGELDRKVRDAGFTILFSGSFNTLLLPLMAASRWMSSKTETGADSELPWREFDLPDLINRFFKGVLQLEISLTLSGLRFPVGGSRVIVAVKTSPTGHQLAELTQSAYEVMDRRGHSSAGAGSGGR